MNSLCVLICSLLIILPVEDRQCTIELNYRRISVTEHVCAYVCVCVFIFKEIQKH